MTRRRPLAYDFKPTLRFVPFDTRTGNPIPDIRKIPEEFVEWRKNKPFYDRLEFVERHTDIHYASKSLTLRSLSDGTIYRLSYYWILKTFRTGVIDHGIIEGYWLHCRLRGYFYGIRPLQEIYVPRRLVAKVAKAKIEQQIRGKASGGIRFARGSGTILLPPEAPETGEDS